MTLGPFDLHRDDLAEARAWLDRRAAEIGGRPERVTWLDRLVGSVVGTAKKAKGGKR